MKAHKKRKAVKVTGKLENLYNGQSFYQALTGKQGERIEMIYYLFKQFEGEEITITITREQGK